MNITVLLCQKTMSKNSSRMIYSFHEVHGNDILVTKNGSIARRMESKDSGLVFTAKPIKINQKITIKLLEVSNQHLRILSVGFTLYDPSTLQNDLPTNEQIKDKLKRKSGFWMCSLSKNVCVTNSTLFFYVKSSGYIHYGVNGKEQGHVQKNVNTNVQLWALINLWAPQTAITFINTYQKPEILDVLKISKIHIKKDTKDEQVATSNKNYIFTTEPLKLKNIVQILFLKDDSLVLGVTSCNPQKLDQTLLPKDPDLLLDRQEYWIVIEDPTFQFKRDDELTFTITPTGEMKLWKNSSLLLKVIHVDYSSNLWGYFITSQKESISVTTELAQSTANSEVKEESTCVVCCDNAPEAALYPCGHMCMCFECANKQWKNIGDCILCRAKIQDVLKVYKS